MARSYSLIVFALFVGAGCHGSIVVSEGDASFDPCDDAACVSCEADVDCDDGDPCNGTERCHPDRGVCYKSDNRPQEGAECCSTGLCLPACFEDADCGEATYCGGNPVCSDGVCVRVPPEEGAACPLDDGGAQGVCRSGECVSTQRFCTATYDLDGHELAYVGMEWPMFVISGNMILHYEANANDDGPLEGGDVAVRHLWIRKSFVSEGADVTVTTNANVYTPRCNGEEVTTEWNPPPPERQRRADGHRHMGIERGHMGDVRRAFGRQLHPR